jgi:hypothetical protein
MVTSTFRLPAVSSPEKYAGLYVFDFGERVALGYTADEILILLETEKHRDGKVYRIRRAMPDGTMELEGVPRSQFGSEDGMFFYRSTLPKARRDYEELLHIAATNPPPCQVKVHLSKLQGGAACVTALIYPAECTQDVGQWLVRTAYQGGERVEGGIEEVADYHAAKPLIVDRHQLGPAGSASRSAEEVLGSTHLAVQRVFA